MMWLKSPLVSPQEIRIVDILFGFKPDAFPDQKLIEKTP